MTEQVVVLTGGVGGAKLTLGFYHNLPAHSLTAVVNTGDDFTHYGLRICPDIDTTLYTLAKLANPEQGWGRTNESWQCLQTLASLGGEDWFQLGDKDLALHLLRSEFLRCVGSLSEWTQQTASRMAIAANILPMSDQEIATQLDTDEGRLAFQEYFVKRRCEPQVQAIHYQGADQAQPSTAVIEALSNPELQAVVIAPSNPFLSVAPILAVPGMQDLLRQTTAPVIAVTPVIGDSAVKGPTAKIMRELQLLPSAGTVADYYGDLIDGFVLDHKDQSLQNIIASDEVLCTDTLMLTLADKQRLAAEVLAFARRLSDQ